MAVLMASACDQRVSLLWHCPCLHVPACACMCLYVPACACSAARVGTANAHCRSHKVVEARLVETTVEVAEVNN